MTLSVRTTDFERDEARTANVRPGGPAADTPTARADCEGSL